MTPSSITGWARAGTDAWSLGIEAATIIGLRMSKVALGGSGATEELRLMMTEKLEAVVELQAAALTGRLGVTPLAGTQNTLGYYRRKVAANHRRLARQP